LQQQNGETLGNAQRKWQIRKRICLDFELRLENSPNLSGDLTMPR
jgi:hypothetical protein